MIGNLRHAGIVVLNVNKSIKFYESLGLELASLGTVNTKMSEILYNIKTEIVWAKMAFPDGGALIELYQLKDSCLRNKIFESMDLPNFSHISITVKDIKKIWTFFKKKKLLISNAIIEDNGHYLFFAKDSDGNILELVEKVC